MASTSIIPAVAYLTLGSDTSWAYGGGTQTHGGALELCQFGAYRSNDTLSQTARADADEQERSRHVNDSKLMHERRMAPCQCHQLSNPKQGLGLAMRNLRVVRFRQTLCLVGSRLVYPAGMDGPVPVADAHPTLRAAGGLPRPVSQEEARYSFDTTSHDGGAGKRRRPPQQKRLLRSLTRGCQATAKRPCLLGALLCRILGGRQRTDALRRLFGGDRYSTPP